MFFISWWTPLEYCTDHLQFTDWCFLLLDGRNEKLGSIRGTVTRVTLRLIFTDYECAHVGVETNIDFTIGNYLAGSFHSVTGTRCPIVTVD